MSSLPDYLFLIPVLVLILSEIVKASIEGIETGEWHRRLFHPGGMPSSHSAFVTSLLMIVAQHASLRSAEFAIAFCFASIVWYDAVTVRRQLGEQGKVLNRLQSWEHLAERLGHSVIEVIAGIAFGAGVTFVVMKWISG